MSLTLVHAIWTAVMLVIFIGIVRWAWSARRKRQFDEAAHIPLNDDDAGENRHG